MTSKFCRRLGSKLGVSEHHPNFIESRVHEVVRCFIDAILVSAAGDIPNRF